MLDYAVCYQVRLLPCCAAVCLLLVQAKLLCRLLDAATGMAYLHGKGVLHGDLKAGNVLLQSTVHGTYGQVRGVCCLLLCSVGA
jgi:serine/threonine protein kinase